MQKRKFYSFSSRDLFLIGVVLVFFALTSILSQGVFVLPPSGGISGFDVAQIASTCGTTQSCSCGDSLSSSRTLNSSDNLTTCFSSTDLQITASDVVLDCNSFLLSGGNTSSASGIVVSASLTNITIKNCNIFNFTTNGISLSGTGNNSFIENNNITFINSSGSARGVFISGALSNITLQGNTFNSTTCCMDGIVVLGGANMTLRNNTFNILRTAITLGSLSVPTTNFSITGNTYIGPINGISFSDGIYAHNIVRDENTQGVNDAFQVAYFDGNVTNIIINISLVSNSTKIINFNNPNSTFIMNQNESNNNYTLSTLSFNGTVNLLRSLRVWDAKNISFQDNFSVGITFVNYTLLTNNTVGGAFLYVNGNLNKSLSFNSLGTASAKLTFNPGNLTNISFGIDTTAPNITLLTPLTPLDSGTTNTLLNISTDENASCRYDTSNVAFASLSTPFTSTTNFTHYATLTGLENGTSYTYYVACQDLVQNTGTTLSVNFSEAAAPVVTPVSDSSGGSGGGGSSTGSTKSSLHIVRNLSKFPLPLLNTTGYYQNLSNSSTEALTPSPVQMHIPSFLQIIFDWIRSFFLRNKLLLYLILLLLLLLLLFWGLLRALKPVPLIPMLQKKTMKDCYAFFKKLQQLSLSGNALQKKRVQLALEIIQKQFTESWLSTRTKIYYTQSSEVRIVHGFLRRSVILPDFSLRTLSSCTGEKDISFLQAYFGTKDDLKTIIDVLTFISGKTGSETLLVLPPVEGRAQYPERIAGLDFNKGYFRLSASGLPT